MINQTYCSEIEAILIQFVSAFDDGKIYRKNNNDSSDYKIVIPRWIISGKSRVMFDIVNQAGNITLPAAVVELKGINLDKDRLFNKQNGQSMQMGNMAYKYKQPTPVSIKVDVNFFTTFMNDIYQMMSNFTAFSNPYEIISWQTPNKEKPFSEEIRSTVTWEGNFNVEYPINAEPNKTWIITGKASFTIKAWIFQQEPYGENIITSVKNNVFNSVQRINEQNEFEFIAKDGWPSLTNVILDNISLPLMKQTSYPIGKGKQIILEGRSFYTEQCTNILIVPKDITTTLELLKVTVTTIKMGDITGYIVPNENINVVNENTIRFDIPELPKDLEFDIIIYNNAGYVKLQEELGFTLQYKD